jgi:hypothetical protein
MTRHQRARRHAIHIGAFKALLAVAVYFFALGLADAIEHL